MTDPSRRPPSGEGRLSRHGVSIAVKLPLLIGGLLAVVIASYSWAAYRTVKHSARQAAEGRLTNATNQLAELLHQSRDRLATHITGMADTAQIREFVLLPTPEGREDVLGMLRDRLGENEQLAQVQVLDARRRRLAALGDTARWGEATDELVGRLTRSDSMVMGPFDSEGDSVVFAIAAPIISSRRIRGYLVEWWRIAQSPKSRETTNKLIGPGARLYIGVVGQGTWTDLWERVPAPPVNLAQANGIQYYERAGSGPVLAYARSVPGTPWTALVEFPQSAVSGPAHEFLRYGLLIGLGILLVGLVLSWFLSRRITVPLSHLAASAEAIAAGNYAQPIALEVRNDELGRLASSFGEMVRQVRGATERLEERVRDRTTELQERNEELEAFAYSISHDLRAPLRAMEGFSQALLEDYGERLDDTGRRYASRVSEAARRMDQLIRDLLSYSRVARSDLRLQPLDPAPLVQTALDQLGTELHEREAQVEIDLAGGPVLAHETTLLHVVQNLLSNAVKFVAPGRRPRIRVWSEAEGSRVRLWIEDNGIGIAPQYREQIFRVFERLHGEEYPGTGIGLAIVRKGVERMGGAAGFEDNPAGGSRFWIELPAAQAERERAG